VVITVKEWGYRSCKTIRKGMFEKGKIRRTAWSKIQQEERGKKAVGTEKITQRGNHRGQKIRDF